MDDVFSVPIMGWDLVTARESHRLFHSIWASKHCCPGARELLIRLMAFPVCSSGSRVLASLGQLVLVGTNVAGSHLWSSHAALVSADGIKKTGFQWDSVDRGTR